MYALFKICLSMIVVISTLTVVYPANENQADGNLLDNYLPACMQALAYYIDLLQYEPIKSTTIEPPFFAEIELEEKSTTYLPPTTTKSTTKKPASSWFQSPSWWSSSTSGYETTTTTTRPTPTHIHKPGLYAPYSSEQLYANHVTTEIQQQKPEQYNEVGINVKFPFNSDASFIQWLKAQKPRLSNHVTYLGLNLYINGIYQHGLDDDVDNDALNRLPLLLVKDLDKELDNQHQKPELQNLDNFLQNYDDSYGKHTLRKPLVGKKRIPPTKAYVEFLLIYDLLKRDAKAANLSKYEGYTEKIIGELYELSNASPQRQLYTLFKNMLDRKEIQRSDIVTRAQKLIKELGDGKSVISMSIMYFPPLQFLP